MFPTFPSFPFRYCPPNSLVGACVKCPIKIKIILILIIIIITTTTIIIIIIRGQARALFKRSATVRRGSCPCLVRAACNVAVTPASLRGAADELSFGEAALFPFLPSFLY